MGSSLLEGVEVIVWGEVLSNSEVLPSEVTSPLHDFFMNKTLIRPP